MKKSHIILRKAIERAGVKSVASKLKLSRTLIYKWCEESPKTNKNFEASGSANPLDRLKKIYNATNDIELINWVCQLADGHFVKNINTKSTSIERDIFKNTEKLVKEFSEALAIISKSYGKGREISPDEAKAIRKEWEDLKRAGETFVKACEAGVFKREKGR